MRVNVSWTAPRTLATHPGDSKPANDHNHPMDLEDAIATISHIEHNPLAPESVYQPAIETIIADLMDATFEATDTNTKVRLAGLELRARAVLERWEVRAVN